MIKREFIEQYLYNLKQELKKTKSKIAKVVSRAI